MNNAKVVEDYSAKEEKVEKQRALAANKEKATYAASVLEMIRAVKSFGPFKSFIKLVVDPEVKKLRSTLDESKDLIDLYRAQGSTKTIAKVFNLEALEKEWSDKHRIYEQRSKDNSENKEI